MAEESEIPFESEGENLVVVGKNIRSGEELALIESHIEAQTFEPSNVVSILGGIHLSKS